MKKEQLQHPDSDFFVEFWAESWTYIRTVVDNLREPVLILDKDCKVIAANEAFYLLFQVKPVDTEGKLLYDLGNGQWNIPALRKLLENVLPKETFFKGFQVDHLFPFIGQKSIILNARRVYSKNATSGELFPPIIVLAMEDITSIMAMANTVSNYTKNLEQAFIERTKRLEENTSVQ